MPDIESPAQELQRYRDLLGPLEQMNTTGNSALPDDERESWERAVASSGPEHDDPIEIEESIATFARVLWSSPGWVEPPARIAAALSARTRRMSEPHRSAALDLAEQFAARATRIDSSAVLARLATVELRLLRGDLQQAEKAAALLPSKSPAALGLRSELAEARARYGDAISLLHEQIEHESSPATIRSARRRIAGLHRTAGELDQAIDVLRASLTEYPDHGPSRRDLGLMLREHDALLDAFSELENAVVLGQSEAGHDLEEVAAELDRRSLSRFRKTLWSSEDGETLDLCPSSTEAEASESSE